MRSIELPDDHRWLRVWATLDDRGRELAWWPRGRVAVLRDRVRFGVWRDDGVDTL